MSDRRQKSRKNYEEEKELDNNDGDNSSLKKRKVAKIKNEDNDDYNEEPVIANKRSKAASSLSASSQPDDEDEEEGDNDDDSNHDDDGNEDLSELETGQVMKVYVQDFMCHNKLTVDFGRHVNFVTGANGSGKSAIVAALQLCLGATAGNTGRGTKLEGLIREGSDGPAIMRVTLLNEGPDAYKQEDYGDRIVVERKLNKGGGGGYKLLSKDGKTISTERKELDRILMTFNIQVQNPCCVLTQEESKKFIQGQEKEKYQFFLKATGLEMTKSELLKANDFIISTETAVDKGRRNLSSKKEAREELKKELQKLMDLDKYDERIQECHAWTYWFVVYAIDDVIKEFQTKFEADERCLLEAQKELLRVEGVEAASGNKEEIKKKIEAIHVDLEDAMADIDERNNVVKEKSLEVSAIQRDLRTITSSKAENNSRLSNVKKEISDLRTRALENAADNERVILESIDECNKVIEAKEGEERAFRNEKNSYSSKLEGLKKEAFQWDNETRNAENEIRSAEAEFKRCSDTSQGRASVFGPKIPDILRAIKSQRFKGEVVGPLGVYIKMKDGHGRWGEALEKSLFKILSSFIVTSADDQRTLMGIFNSLGCQQKHSAICQAQCPRFNVAAIEGALAVCDAIIVESDLVFNCIIDQAKIDQTIMVADEEEVKKHFCLQNGLNGFRDPRVKNAITARGTRIEFRMGNQGSQLNSAPFNRLLVADTGELLIGLTERIAERKVALKDAKGHQKESYDQLGQLQNQMKRNDEVLRDIANKMRYQKKRKEDLEIEINEIQAAGRIDTTNLEEEEGELKDVLLQLSASEGERKAMMDEVVAELRRLKLDVTEAEKRKLAFEKDFKKESSKLEKLLENDESKKRDVERARRDVAAKEKTLSIDERIQGDQRIERQTNLDIANTKTPDLIANWDGNPVEVHPKWNSEQKLRTEMVRLQKLQEKEKEKAGLEGRSREWVSDQLKKATDSYRSAKEDVTRITEELVDLKIDHKRRQKLWKHRRKSNENIVRRHFDIYLQRKGFAGTVEFNHELESLHILCQTDNANDSSRVNDVRQLSGGERSYTTLCLLLALGHVIEFPFRLMDEYDVFLDEVSRKVTLTELQRYALLPQQRGRQFLIITPNNLNDVITSNDVKIKRMAPPSRNSAHGLQQQTLD